MEVQRSQCYCCGTSLSQGLDLDAALNELGMLSTTTEGHRDFQRERHQRQRYISEPPGLSTSICPTPATSPARPSYQVVQLNTQYVTDVSTGSPPKLNNLHPIDIKSLSKMQLKDGPSAACRLEFGDKYSKENLETEAQKGRLARLKLARLKRFQRPYDLPWKHNMEQHYHERAHTLHVPITNLLSTPEKSRLADKECNSNSTTPEKPATSSLCSVPRSKSLDELDFAKLHLAEAENKTFIQERKDIETVSQHLKDLHVNE